MRKILLIIICILPCIFVTTMNAQEKAGATPLPGMRGTPKNIPDISVIGDIRGYKNKIFLEEIEIAMQGYLYPEMRSDVYFAFHRHEDGEMKAELEEGYVTFLQILGGLSTRAGKMLVDFGKLNKLHTEQWLYTSRPKVLSNFLGGHGLNANGIEASYLFPLPFFLQLNAGTWDAPAPESGEFGLKGSLVTGRLWSSFAQAETAELEFGASYLSGNGPEHPKKADGITGMGMDVTYKYWFTTYRRLMLQIETLVMNRRGDLLTGQMNGFFCYAGYKFNKYWDAGFRYDAADNVLPLNTDSSLKERKSSVTVIATNRLTEVTRLRVQAGYDVEDKSAEGFLQLIFGIGPHSHALQ